jgi:hypothetical protein
MDDINVIDFVNEDGDTVLKQTLDHHHFKDAEALIRAGADIFISSSNNKSVLDNIPEEFVQERQLLYEVYNSVHSSLK